MKFAVLFSIFIFVSSAGRAADEVLLPQKQAVQYCQSQGAHLPTARDWADLAVQRGAKGIRESAYPGVLANDPRVLNEIVQNESEGYQTIYFTKLAPNQLSAAPWAGDFVDFYYSREGYQVPSDPADLQEFWSSTVNLKSYDWAWYFQGKSGFLTFEDRFITAAVRCVP